MDDLNSPPQLKDLCIQVLMEHISQRFRGWFELLFRIEHPSEVISAWDLISKDSRELHDELRGTGPSAMVEIHLVILNWSSTFSEGFNARKIILPYCQTMMREMLGDLILRSARVNYLMPLHRTESHIVQNVGIFVNITELILSGEHVYIASKKIEDIIRYLNKLVKFEYTFRCTNGIIRQLGKHCKQMEEINFSYSKELNDECIEDLLKLTQLRSVNLQNSRITDYYYAILLINLKLWNIILRYNVDGILHRVPQSNLNRLRSISCCTKDPTLLVRYLPLLSELTLCIANDDISTLGEMSSLKVFNLIACYYKKINFAHSIVRLGEHLMELRLFGIIELRFTDIILSCKVLKTLEFDTCQFDVNTDVDVRSELPHFESLENLKLVNCDHTDKYVNLFGHYAALQRLRVRNVSAFNDIILKNAIENDRLNNLRELIVENCNLRNPTNVISAINNSTHLQTFGNLKKIECFEGENDDNMKRDIRATNFDLTLISDTVYYVRTGMFSYLF